MTDKVELRRVNQHMLARQIVTAEHNLAHNIEHHVQDEYATTVATLAHLYAIEYYRNHRTNGALTVEAAQRLLLVDELS